MVGELGHRHRLLGGTSEYTEHFCTWKRGTYVRAAPWRVRNVGGTVGSGTHIELRGTGILSAYLWDSLRL